MNKKITIILLIILCVFFQNSNVIAEANDFSYEKFVSDSYNYISDDFDINNISDNGVSNLKKLYLNVYNKCIHEIKSSLRSYILIIIISVIVSISSAFVRDGSTGDVTFFACNIMFSVILGMNLAEVYDIACNSITDICDYMNISIPAYVVLLASSGYPGVASTLQGMFVLVSNVIAIIIKKYILPILYGCAILAITNLITDSKEINKLIKLVLKYLKYTIGISLTIFSATLGFAGFTASTTDGIAIKTARFAVSNFVPIVGSCLSESLNSIVNTSLVLKNKVGYIAFFVLIMICLTPIIKIYIISFLTKITSFIMSVLINNKLENTLNTLGDVIGTFGSLIVFLSAVFFIVTGIMVSIGG